MASCAAANEEDNTNDCPRSRGEALALFLSRSQNSSSAEQLRASTQSSLHHQRRGERTSRISQHIQLFETRVAARPMSGMSVSMMAAVSGCHSDTSGSGANLSGSGTDMSASVTDMSGSGANLSGSGANLSRSGTDMSGSVADMSGCVADVSGCARAALPEPIYINVTNASGPTTGRSVEGGNALTRKKPVPNPRKSLLLFAPIAESGAAVDYLLDKAAQNSSLLSPPRRPVVGLPRPSSPLQESTNSVAAAGGGGGSGGGGGGPSQPDTPRASIIRTTPPQPHAERRKTTTGVSDHPTSRPPPLPPTGPPIRKAPNGSLFIPKSNLPPTPPRQDYDTRLPQEATARTPVKDAHFLRHLTELTDPQRKCLTLPNHMPRPVFNFTCKSPSPGAPSPHNTSSEDPLHPSRRPLPSLPAEKVEDEEPYSDTSGEPVYQELSEVSSVYSTRSTKSTPLVRQTAVRRHRRDAGHFRSLRGLPADFQGPKAAARASSFTEADMVKGPPSTSSGRSKIHSSSCSSMSLTESDSGVSLELESMRDDMSIRGMPWTSDFQKAVEKMKGFQCRSESLNNNDARAKPTVKTLHHENRRHTLPISVLSSTVFDDGEDDSGQSATDKMITEITACYQPRGLWYQKPGVAESGVLLQLSDDERKIQEAVYEIICSEATHLRSLSVLINVFKNAQEFSSASRHNPSDVSVAVVSQQEERNLFLNVVDVRNTSLALLKDLHERYEQHHAETGLPTMPDFSGILEYFAVNQAKVYVKYCSDQLFQEKTLSGLKERKRFQEVIRRLETQKICEQLPFPSYLMLPMQRITRLPLLIGAVMKRCEPNSPEYIGYNAAFVAMNKVVRECDEGAKRANCIEELCRIDALLLWPDTSLKKIPIISASRSLVKRGTIDVIQIEHKFLPRRTFHKKSMHLLVFNDLFMLTKPKSGSDDALVVVDYCPRNLVDCLQVTAAERDDLLAHTSISAVFATPEAFRGVKLVLLRNSAQRTVEFFLVMSLESDYMRWMSVLNPSEKVEGDEKIYEIWDCPQYEVLADYHANENDELTVSAGDVVDVYRKSSDGWLEGRRMSDGHRGWLPTSVAKELMTEHARARHLKERNRLLAASAQLMKERTSK